MAGGISGYHTEMSNVGARGTIKNSSSSLNINIMATYGYVGGIVGLLKGTVIEDCYFDGKITYSGSIGSIAHYGGIAGYVVQIMTDSTEVYRVWVGTSPIPSSSHGGILFGTIGVFTCSYESMQYLYYNNSVTGNPVGTYVFPAANECKTYLESATGALAKSTTQMHQANTFTTFNFTSPWSIAEGSDYPRLP
jgi:hypothetical protein